MFHLHFRADPDRASWHVVSEFLKSQVETTPDITKPGQRLLAPIQLNQSSFVIYTQEIV